MAMTALLCYRTRWHMPQFPKIDPFLGERTPAVPARIERGLRELALPEDLVDAAKAFTLSARALRTRLAYRRAWAGFETWCRQNGCQALPAAPETVAGWMTALATGKGVPSALARSSPASASRYQLLPDSLCRRVSAVAGTKFGLHFL